MKCKEFDLIGLAEGRASEEMRHHLSECPACREELVRFNVFFQTVLPVYREGKRREEEIERRLASLDRSSLKELPAEIAARVRQLKESRLSERLKKIVKGKRENAEAWIEGLLHPQMEALAASPKDITKTKRARTKKALSKKRKPKAKSTGN